MQCKQLTEKIKKEEILKVLEGKIVKAILYIHKWRETTVAKQ